VIATYTKVDRARRGGSGALNLQSAIAGLNSGLRPLVLSLELGQVVLKTGSRATGIREPRQVREEAAVSEHFCVPRESLVGAGYQGIAWAQLSKVGARSFFSRLVPSFPKQELALGFRTYDLYLPLSQMAPPVF